MIAVGVVKVGSHEDPNHGFIEHIKPISDEFLPEALAVSGFSREETLLFTRPVVAMQELKLWLDQENEGRAVFVSDNPAFDWQFVNYYFHWFLGDNPFGFSARRIGDFYSGLERDWYASQWAWKKKYRKTEHDHNPLNDARGNAEALTALLEKAKSV